LAQGEDVVAIPGTRYPDRLDENIGAMNVQLTAAEIEQISAAVPKGSASGTRYPAGGMSGVYL
jgi:aryl-alcohol dehydrogenase-like predicted oxidoreductase